MFFDTHCHLNFKLFKKDLKEVIERAKKAGVNQIVVPGTDVESSKRAVEIAEKNQGIYAAVGIHPHHIFGIIKKLKETNQKISLKINNLIKEIERLLISKKVVAIGEIGIDRYIYQKTKYNQYSIDEDFIKYQKLFLKVQIDLAIQYQKSIILHKREANLQKKFSRQAKDDLLEIIGQPAIAQVLAGKTVFHCFEPDDELLAFAKKYKIYLGVDGDITYLKEKEDFIKNIPLSLLVLETDSPFLLPEPLRSQSSTKRKVNEPKNLPIIAAYIAKIKNISISQLTKITMKNAKNLFQLSKYEANK